MTAPIEPSRHLTIAGSANLRDVGGYPTRDGRFTRWRTLLRSASLQRLPAESWRALRDYGVHTIIDLRRSGEMSSGSYQIDEVLGMRYQRVPLFEDDTYHIVDQPAQDLDELYQLLLDHCGAQFASVLHTIAAQDAAPALIHCAIGKDRTGLSIALALGVAGVDDATIAADYALSNAQLGVIYDEYRAYSRTHGADMERLERMLLSDQDTMLRTIAYLNTRYGSVAAYLVQAGMTDAELQQLQALLVE